MRRHVARASILSAFALWLASAGPAAAQEPGLPDPPAEPGIEAADDPPPPSARPPKAPGRPPAAARPAPPPRRAYRAYLGVTLEDVDSAAVERLGLREERGALVRDVADGSPADSAGLRAGDVVVAWRGEPVFSAAQLARLVRETPSGRQVRIEVVRDGDRSHLTVVPREREWRAGRLGRHLPPEARDRIRERLREARDRWRDARGELDGLEERPGELGEHMEGAWRAAGDSLEAHRFRVWPGGGDARSRLGVDLRSLTPQLADYFGLGGRTGALAASVRDGSPADSAGIRAGDVLISVGGRDVSDPADAASAVSRAAGEVEIRILRHGDERTLGVRLPDPGEPGEG